MIRVFAYHGEDINSRFKRVFLKTLPAVLILLFSTVPLFYFMAKDSEKNRDAVHKVTSQETENALLAVFAVFLLAVVYLVIMGVRENARLKRRFTNWAYYRGRLYTIIAAFPHSHHGSSNRAMRRVMNAQEGILRFLNDKYTLKQLLDGEIHSDRISVCEVEHVSEVKRTKNKTKVKLADGRTTAVYRSIDGFDELMEILNELTK